MERKDGVKLRKYWRTSRVLSEGIEEIECVPGLAVGQRVYVNGHYYTHGLVVGIDVHQTRAGAVFRAEELRLRKIGSLKRQLKKLEAMKFE